MTTHYYPQELAASLRQRWPTAAAPLPAPEVLTQFISVLYQASLLAEEGRRVECHVILTTQAQLAAQPVGLTDFHWLRFAEPRPYSEQELRRLSPAVHQPNSLLTIAEDADGALMIWGMLFTEHERDQLLDCPRPQAAAVPQGLLVQMSGPGSLVFFADTCRLLTLQRGRIEGHGFLQFPEAWGHGRFTENRLLAGDALPDPVMTPVQALLVFQIGLRMQQRALAHIRAGGHGALVVVAPTPAVAHLTAPGGVLRPKYRLLSSGAGPRYRTLLQAIIRRLGELGEVSWAHFRRSQDALLLALAAEIDHFSEYIARMTAVDGALVLTQQACVAGFGVEVQATQVPLDKVYRALDMEAHALEPVAADHGGTRHRAAYRLCLLAPECLDIVVSQDGNLQFVHAQEGKVVFWDQMAA